MPYIVFHPPKRISKTAIHLTVRLRKSKEKALAKFQVINSRFFELIVITLSRLVDWWEFRLNCLKSESPLDIWSGYLLYIQTRFRLPFYSNFFSDAILPLNERIILVFVVKHADIFFGEQCLQFPCPSHCLHIFFVSVQ